VNRLIIPVGNWSELTFAATSGSAGVGLLTAKYTNYAKNLFFIFLPFVCFVYFAVTSFAQIRVIRGFKIIVRSEPASQNPRRMKMQLLPILICVLWLLSEMLVGITRRAKAGAAKRDGSSFVLIWIVYPLTIWCAVFIEFAVSSWAMPRPELFQLLGLIVFLAGQIFRWYCISHLGRYFTATVAISADHRLIESGPYRWVRHPSYAANFVTVIGFGLSLANLASLLVLIIPTFAAHWWRMRIEENALLEAFGDAYRNYMARTKRLIPFIY
jgi:protein-S-isoprenylcysteine O-methyltransferase Ste14